MEKSSLQLQPSGSGDRAFRADEIRLVETPHTVHHFLRVHFCVGGDKTAVDLYPVAEHVVGDGLDVGHVQGRLPAGEDESVDLGHPLEDAGDERGVRVHTFRVPAQAVDAAHIAAAGDFQYQSVDFEFHSSILLLYMYFLSPNRIDTCILCRASGTDSAEPLIQRKVGRTALSRRVPALSIPVSRPDALATRCRGMKEEPPPMTGDGSFGVPGRQPAGGSSGSQFSLSALSSPLGTQEDRADVAAVAMSMR